MTLEASQKVPDGKMVELELEVNSGEVREARIRGDFFLEPPEQLEKLEEQLEGLKTDVERKEITEKLERVDVDMIGFSGEDVADAFRKAVEGGSSE